MGIDLNIIFVCSFFIVNLFIGIFIGKDVKTLQDYTLGGKNFTTGMITASIVATYVSGSYFFNILTETYDYGIIYIIATSFMAVQLFIMAYFLIPKMQRFLNQASVAEIMGNLYGEKVGRITAISGIISCIGFIAVQFKVCGYIFENFLNISSQFAIPFVGIIVTFYSALGGIRSIIYTNVLQFFIFTIIIPFVGILIWHNLNESPDFNFMLAFEDPKFNFVNIFNFRSFELWEILPLLLYYAIPGMEPAFVQRILISKNTIQAKNAFLSAAAILLFLKLTITFIPIIIFCDNSSLDQSDLFSYFLKYYAPTTLSGFIILAVVTMSVSTADSHLNASSVTFTGLITSVLYSQDPMAQKLSDIQQLALSRLTSWMIGASAVIMALIGTNLINIVLFAQSFYMPIITVPLILTILGFNFSRFSVLFSMGGGFITVIIWKMLGIKYDCIVIAMMINFIFLITSNFIEKRKTGVITA